MSLTARIGRTNIKVRFQDETLAQTDHILRFSPAMTFNQLRSYAELYIPVLQGVSGSGFLKYRLTKTIYYTDDPPDPTNSNVTDAMTMVLSNDQSGRNEVTVPSINPALLLTSGPYADVALDDTLTPVTDMITLLQGFCNEQGYLNVALLESSREQRRQFR